MARLLLVAFAVGLSNFAAAIGIGLSGVDARTRVRVAVVFGSFEATMPVVGLLAGDGLASSVGSASRWVGGGLLLAVGLYTIVKARIRAGRGRARGDAGPVRGGALFVTAAALSIDNLVVGFALGTQTVPVSLAALVIALVSVGMSLIGLELGDRMGHFAESWSEELSGLVLMGVGAAIAAGAL